MLNVIRHEGREVMFGYGFNEANDFGIYFPEQVNAEDVAEFARAQSDLVADVELVEPVQLLPRMFDPRLAHLNKGKEQAARVELLDRCRHFELPERLEQEFDPVAKPWQANYAGTLTGDPNTPLYVVVEGDREDLRSFLSETDEIRLGALAVIDQLSFSIESPDATKVARELPRQYTASLSPWLEP